MQSNHYEVLFNIFFNITDISILRSNILANKPFKNGRFGEFSLTATIKFFLSDILPFARNVIYGHFMEYFMHPCISFGYHIPFTAFHEY